MKRSSAQRSPRTFRGRALPTGRRAGLAGRSAWPAWLLALSLIPAARAQDVEPRFGEAVDVRVVNVDVYVTDRKGRRVSGLTREDFALFEDGRPVAVTHFSRILDRARGGQPEGASAALEPGLDPETPAELLEPLTVILFIDNSTLTPHHRNRVLGDLETFVAERADSGVEFMIAVFNPGLEILARPGADADRARAVLRRVAEMPASGLNVLGERRRALDEIQDLHELYEEAGPGLASRTEGGFGFDPCGIAWERMIGAVDTYAQQAGSRIGDVQAGLVSLTRSLGGIPGRKALLYLSDGLEQQPGVDLYAFLGEICPEREHETFRYMTRWDGTPLLRELAEYASAHRVTLYALETTGLTSYSTTSVEFQDRRFTPSNRNDELRISNLQGSLFMLANQTGGQAFLNVNFPGAELERMAEDFGDYYSLGFEPPGGWDGKSHWVRVELVGEAAKGRTLRYPRRYRAIPESERLAESTLAALVLGREANPLGTEIRIGERRSRDGDVWQLPVEIVLTRAALGMLPGRSGENQLIRVLIMAEDERGRRTPLREKLIPLASDGSDEAGESATLVVNLELEPGRHTIAIGVRDEINRRSSFHRATVSLGGAETGASGPPAGSSR